MRLLAPLTITAASLSAGASHAEPPAAASRDSAFEYLRLAEQANVERSGPKGEQWAKRLRAERAGYLSALEWMIGNGHPEAALRLVGALGPFWDYEYVEGGRGSMNRVLALPGNAAPTLARSRALLYAGVLAFRMGDQDAAEKQITDSLAIARQLADAKLQSQALSALARNALRIEDHGRVRKQAEEAMRIATGIGDRRLAASARHMLAYSASMQGELDRAEGLYRENVRVASELGDKELVATETGNLAYLEFDRGNHDAARSGFRDYMRMSQESGDNSGIADALMGFALVEVASGRAEQGAKVLGAVQSVYKKIGIAMDPASKKDFDKAVAEAKQAIGAARFRAAFASGEAMDLQAAVATVTSPATSMSR